MVENKTKLVIKVEAPPISIFKMNKGKQETDMTQVYESAWASANYYYWMVPDGVYLVTQGACEPCVYEVTDGDIKVKPVKTAPIGNAVEALTAETKPRGEDDVKGIDKGVTLSEIMHTSSPSKSKHKKK